MDATKAKRKETFRLKKLCSIEQRIQELGFSTIAGVDESGRGPLAGPVVAAACILPSGFMLRGIDDSKKLTKEQRDLAYQELILHPEIIFGIGVVEAVEIDQINIHHASLLAMKKAVCALSKKPHFLLIDGLHVPDCDIPSESVIRGDSKVQLIAAASVFAKVVRDQIMVGYHALYPEYEFASHKGYGTRKHLEAIDRNGLSPIHRMSFCKRNLQGEIDESKYDSLQPNGEFRM